MFMAACRKAVFLADAVASASTCAAARAEVPM